MIKWAQDLGHNIGFEKWGKMWTKTIKFTACMSLKENVTKVMYRWYITPAKLAKMYRNQDKKCWKCKEKEGNFYHMWWTCTMVKAYWDIIYNELKKILKYNFNKK